MNNNQVERKVTLGEKLGFMFYGTGGTAIYYFRSYYYAFFLTNVLYLDVKFAGQIVAIGTVWDAINDLLIGYFVSKHVFKNGEQLKPYSLFIFPLALNTAMMFCDFSVSQKTQGLISLVLYLMVSVFFTFFTTSQNNIALVTRTDEGRIALGTFNSLGTTIGTAFGSLACLPILKMMGAMDAQGNLADGKKFVWAATIICGVAVACVMIYYFCVHERYQADKKAAESLKFMDAMKFLVREKLWIYNVLQNLMIALNTSLVTANIAYYATYELHSTSIMTKILLINTLCSLAIYPFIGKLSARFGRTKTLYIAFGIMAAGKAIFALFPQNILSAYINMVSIGVATGLGQVVLCANRNEIADRIDEKEHVRVDSLVGMSVTFSLKIASALATSLTAALLSRVGFNGALPEQSGEVISVLNGLMGWIPLVIIVVVVLLTTDFKALRKE